MTVPWTLVLVGPLFFVALASMLYVAAWLAAVSVLRLGEVRHSHAAAKRVTLTALMIPPVLALTPTVAGIILKHHHALDALMHHSATCRVLFVRFFPIGEATDTVLPAHIAAGIAVNGAAWLLALAGALAVLRLAWATFRLDRALAPALRPASPRLRSSIRRVRERLPWLHADMFHEAGIPMRLSGLVGVFRVRCVLSSELVSAASDDELDAVVAHEASHRRAGDAAGSFVVDAVERFFFYLRPVRLLCRRWREEAELACDAAAVSLTGNPLALAAAVLRAWGAPLEPPNAPSAFAGPGLAKETACTPARRVETLLIRAKAASPPAPETRFRIMVAWLSTLCVAGIGVALALSPEAACYAHCGMEAVARLLP